MRALIADKLPESARHALIEGGLSVVFDATLAGDTLLAAMEAHDPDVLLVRSTKVTAAHIAAGKSLQLIVRAGAGVNTIDLDAASSHAVYVANCPGMNAVAVAELTWGHILNADRRIADNVADLRAGQWRKKTYAKARGLKDRVLGVIGCGAIGRAVIERGQAFGMRVMAWDPMLDAEGARDLGVGLAADIVELARCADVLTLHVPLNDATRGMADAELFGALRPGAIFVNTSRGPVVDEAALSEAVRTKGIRAGLDVFCGEPGAEGEWSQPLAKLDGVYGTHHIGASTDQAQEAVAAEACRVVLEWAHGGEAPNCVNLATATPATHRLVVRHADEVGVLAGILTLLREAGINVQRMRNIIFSGEKGAACARINIMGPLDDGLVERLRGSLNIFDVKVLEI